MLPMNLVNAISNKKIARLMIITLVYVIYSFLLFILQFAAIYPANHNAIVKQKMLPFLMVPSPISGRGAYILTTNKTLIRTIFL